MVKRDERIKNICECFEKSIRKELSIYLIKSAMKDGLLSTKTGEKILKTV